MSTLNEAPRGERIHIAFFGCRNAGKSSLLNAFAGQEVALVSPVKGTTTDPVYKAMELQPIGPVELIDTPGLDDEDPALGGLRVRRALEVLDKTDIAVLVVSGETGVSPADEEALGRIRTKGIPCLCVLSKCDLPTGTTIPDGWIACSAKTGQGIPALAARLVAALPVGEARRIVGDLLKPEDFVVLVTPIDAAAPKGRLILPQQETLRDVLDSGACALVVKETGLAAAFPALARPPALVITDSQAFAVVAGIVPPGVPLTSFSILFARYKGDLATLVAGAKAVAALKDGDRVLVAEGCTHHRQEDDIGTVKIPRLLMAKTGKRLVFEHARGMGYPDDLGRFALIVHCGGCMLNRREFCRRVAEGRAAGVPVTNYGILLALLNGILPRCLEPFRLEVEG
ncbi:MAG: [FeFe] hydrogenase H-cluster maturation GTPase HydF [Kiritimatiellae bacterium]|nr:[FeFe] hydrogenase H-cluster maturation GTPase HydF [Kiritimatiellia bacterium]